MNDYKYENTRICFEVQNKLTTIKLKVRIGSKFKKQGGNYYGI